jgi:hypothetical protein
MGFGGPAVKASGASGLIEAGVVGCTAEGGLAHPYLLSLIFP